MSSNSAAIPTTLKWSKHVYTSADDDERLAIHPGSSTNRYKSTIQQITGVPVDRQKLLCKHGWKGMLKSDTSFGTDLSLPPKQSSLTITLIGSADKLSEPPTDRPKFIEDVTPEEVEAERTEQQAIDDDNAEGMIVALQRPPGEVRSADSNRTAEPYQYNRMVHAVPQYRIEKMLHDRRTLHDGELQGSVVMTMGLELRRAYVNDLATLPDGTLISVLDDGHVQMWQHAELVEDVVHGNADAGGVEHVVALPQVGGSSSAPAFATAGQGVVKLWNDEGEAIAAMQSPRGTSPCALVAAAIGYEGNQSLLLATAHRVTYQPDPNQFRLVPQDEAGRRRRAQAEEQERQLRLRLDAAAARVQVSIQSGGQLQQMTIEPPSDGRGREVVSPPVTSLAALDRDDGTILVIGNACGELRLVQFRRDNNLMGTDYKLMHLNPANGGTASIVCMEPLGGSLLAVSTRQRPADDSTSSSTHALADSVAIDVPLAQAVYIIDIEKCACDLIIDGHSDAVQAMCLLPDGSLATCGGKMDAKSKVWDKSLLGATSGDGHNNVGMGEANVRVLTESSATLDDVGYVLALTVLPDTKPGSKHYALAAARYNVVKICI